MMTQFLDSIEGVEEGIAFETFKALGQGADAAEADQLFRSMAQLFSLVSDKCDDAQVAQYDKVLCQLSDAVEEEARSHVAKLLAPLDRAPGRVVVRLAHDSIEVARPLLEFSKVLTDDDLIEIVSGETEDHRTAIAGRNPVGARVGEAIADFGGTPSLKRLLHNEAAEFSSSVLEKLVGKAANDDGLARDLRQRTDIDWAKVHGEISAAGARVIERLALTQGRPDARTARMANEVAYQRTKNLAGFSAREWRLAWNQVKALADRRQLDMPALARFARFGYGHHAAAGLTMMLSVPEPVFVKWLSTQDFVAVTVALRAMGLEPELARDLFPVLPWRDALSGEDVANVLKRFEALSAEEAKGIFRLWRAHAFRRRTGAAREAVA